jgi:hypothetical protein
MPHGVRPTRRLLIASALLAAAAAATAGEPERAETLATFTVRAGPSARFDTPVSASLDGLSLDPATRVLELREVVGARRVPAPAQIAGGFTPRLWWILSGPTAAGAARTFELVARTGTGESDEPGSGVTVKDDGETLTLSVQGHPAVRYQYAPVPAPEGASPLYSRGGFLHPIWSPAGEILTRIQPPDHFHHVGLWNPWTRTQFEGRQIDFWNLADGQGTVRATAVLSTVAGAVFGGFRALLDHVDLRAPGGPKTALHEEWQVRAWNLDPAKGVALVDFVSTLSCATDSPLTIEAYRYQGFGFRATATWDDETATLLTSEGRNKSDANATRARWCDIRGPSKEGTAGIVFMSHPANFNHPEPLRIWPTGANEGKENVFFNFNPAQDRDWTLRPGRTYTLRYRMLVYDGAMEAARAEQRWRDLAHPPRVTRE